MQKFHLEYGKRLKYKIQILCVYRAGSIYTNSKIEINKINSDMLSLEKQISDVAVILLLLENMIEFITKMEHTR